MMSFRTLCTVLRPECYSALMAALILLPTISFAQVYLGAGYSEFTGELGSDNAGIVVTVQREIVLNKLSSRLRINPTLHTRFLYRELDSDFQPRYGNTLAFSSLFSYDILHFRAFALAPLVGPFAALRVSLQRGSLAVPDNHVSQLHGGLEVGLAATITITKKFRIKIIPLGIQFGGIRYSQGTLATVMIEL